MRRDQPIAYPDCGSIAICGVRENDLKSFSPDIAME